MSKIYTSADQLIGGTPLLEITNTEKALGLKATVLAKLEYLNPAGSVKDRIAKRMIDDAEASGALKPGAGVPAEEDHGVLLQPEVHVSGEIAAFPDFRELTVGARERRGAEQLHNDKHRGERSCGPPDPLISGRS